MEIEATRPWWGIVCKGCGRHHPTAMCRGKKDAGRFEKDERFKYRCPNDDQTYEYVGSDEKVFDYTLSPTVGTASGMKPQSQLKIK